MGPNENGLSLTGSSAIYKFSNGFYAFDRAIALYREFDVGGLMSEDSVQFREDPANQLPPVKEFVLRVINGPNYGTLKFENGRIDLMQQGKNKNHKKQHEEDGDQGRDADRSRRDGQDDDDDRGVHTARVASARIHINGTEVVAMGQINSGVDRFETRVKLAQNNTISVNLEGKQGAGILVILDPVFDWQTK